MTDSDTPAADIEHRRRLRLVAAALMVVVLGAIVLWAIYVQHYRGRIYPGVSVSGVELGGLTPDEAADRLQAQLPVYGWEITLRDAGDAEDPDDDRVWPLAPADLGITANSLYAADSAYRVGRGGFPLTRPFVPLVLRLRGADYPAEVTFDADRARATLTQLAAAVDVSPRDAALGVGDDGLVETAPQYGRQMDVEGTIALLAALTDSPGQSTVDIATVGTAPRVGDVVPVSDAYRRITSGPVRLTFRPDFEHVFPLEQIESWVEVRDMANEMGDIVPAIVFDEIAMRQAIEPLAQQIDRDPREPRFDYDINTSRVTVRERAEIGYRLDPVGSVQRVIDAAYTDTRVAEAAVREIRPNVPTDAVGEMTDQLRHLGGAGTRITGVPAGRLQNLLVAADQVNGVAIPPGGEFSFNEALGAVSAEAGYDLTQLGPTAPEEAQGGLRGGISQVATTAFRTAFWAGLPITERHAPLQRIGWVEPPIGLDAAAGTPDADLRFINDSDGYMLVQSELDPMRGALTWRLYGPLRERRVEALGPDVTNVTPAGDSIARDDARLPAGSRVQIDWAREGAEATVTRIVTEDGAEVLRDTFSSRYAPASDVVLTGSAD